MNKILTKRTRIVSVAIYTLFIATLLLSSCTEPKKDDSVQSGEKLSIPEYSVLQSFSFEDGFVPLNIFSVNGGFMMETTSNLNGDGTATYKVVFQPESGQSDTKEIFATKSPVSGLGLVAQGDYYAYMTDEHFGTMPNPTTVYQIFVGKVGAHEPKKIYERSIVYRDQDWDHPHSLRMHGTTIYFINDNGDNEVSTITSYDIEKGTQDILVSAPYTNDRLLKRPIDALSVSGDYLVYCLYDDDFYAVVYDLKSRTEKERVKLPDEIEWVTSAAYEEETGDIFLVWYNTRGENKFSVFGNKYGELTDAMNMKNKYLFQHDIFKNGVPYAVIELLDMENPDGLWANPHEIFSAFLFTSGPESSPEAKPGCLWIDPNSDEFRGLVIRTDDSGTAIGTDYVVLQEQEQEQG